MADIRNITLRTVVNSKERRAIKERAKAAGMSVSSFTRWMALRGVVPAARLEDT